MDCPGLQEHQWRPWREEWDGWDKRQEKWRQDRILIKSRLIKQKALAYKQKNHTTQTGSQGNNKLNSHQKPMAKF